MIGMNNGHTSNIPDKLATIVSIVFHPLLMPFYGLIILLSAPTFLTYLPADAKRVLLLIVFIDNIFLPMAFLPFLRYRNIISSYHIDDRKERIIPLLTTSILYCTTSFIIFRYQIPFFLKSFIFATSVVAIVVSMINFWWKISIHAVGAGALLATIYALSMKMYTPLTWYLVTVILASGLVLSSRLRLNSHNPAQVWLGFLTGFIGISLFILLI
jgi:glucan phosphoethanolaminetransferase (alkaline phosphatase superfamily)